METEYPYQLVSFIGRTPPTGELVYLGKNGWYAHFALKRRFRLVLISEDQAEKELKKVLSHFAPFEIHTKELIHPSDMPGAVIEVEKSPELITFRDALLASMDGFGVSKKPELDEEKYLPHITAEYEGKAVINANEFTNQTYTVSDVWVIKDINDGDSVVYGHYQIG